MIHFDLGDLKNAQSCAQQALELSQQTNEKHLEGPSWIFLGKILGKADSSQVRIASETFFRGIKICKDLKFCMYSQFICNLEKLKTT